MSWNYRIVNDHYGYAIREVYYDEGVPSSWSEMTIAEGETLEELGDEMALIQRALNTPVLYIGDRRGECGHRGACDHTGACDHRGACDHMGACDDRGTYIGDQPEHVTHLGAP
jgi:hypothetical protein